MDKDTVKLIRIPADTWRAVVEALLSARITLDVTAEELGEEINDGVERWLPRLADVATTAQEMRRALELARKVKP